jgi:hypothetical protein
MQAASPIRDKEIIGLSTTVAEKCCTLLRDEENLLPVNPEPTVMVMEQQVLDGCSGFDVTCNNKNFNQAMVEQSRNIYCVDTKFKATAEDIEFLMRYVDEVDVHALRPACELHDGVTLPDQGWNHRER